MGRIPTFRSNYDDLKKLTLADLKRLGLLVPEHRTSSTIRWTRRGETTGEIGVTVDLTGAGGFVEMRYIFNGEGQMKYQIQLVQAPSNLGRGQVWYFICPITGERCRTLYQSSRYFASRKAQPDMLYESQTYSKHYRWLDKTFGPELKLDHLYNGVYKRYAKKHYRGKPTPKMKKALQMERANDLSKGKTPKSLEEYLFESIR